MSDGVLDTCCLINFVASGQCEAILQVLGRPLYVPEAVRRESLFLAPEEPDGARHTLRLDDIVQELDLTIIAPAGDAELSLYVSLAADLDDGEAMALALAKSRGLTLLTDERKAAKRAAALDVPVLTTFEVLHKWAADAETSIVSDAISRIERLARYTPSPRSPLFDWWQSRRPSAGSTVS